MHLSMLSLTSFDQYSAQFFPSYWLLSHKILSTVEGGMNPVKITIISPQKEYWPSLGLNQGPPVLKSCTPGLASAEKGKLKFINPYPNNKF